MFTKFRTWRLAEKGVSTAALLILSLPLMLGAFGFGFDALRLSYAKRYAQGRLDLATQSAAAVTYTAPDGSIKLGISSNPDAWKAEAYRSYTSNTDKMRQGAPNTHQFFQCTSGDATNGLIGTTCGGLAEVIGSAPPVGFDFCQNTKYANPIATRPTYGVRYTVKETVPTMFMRILGVNEMTFTISSETLLRQRNC